MESVPRPHKFHFGARVRCHRCGSYRITKLKVRDKIDPMERGLLNFLEKLAGGQLYHCKFCRIQFWDRRKFIPQPAPAAAPSALSGQTPPEAPKQPEAQPQAAQATRPAASEVEEDES